jgi:hypothetical protein
VDPESPKGCENREHRADHQDDHQEDRQEDRGEDHREDHRALFRLVDRARCLVDAGLALVGERRQVRRVHQVED